MNTGLGIPYICNISIHVVSISCKIPIACVEICLLCFLVIDNPVFYPACHGLSDNPLLFVIRVDQITCARKIRNGKNVSGIVIRKADALTGCISYRHKTPILIQQAYFIPRLVRYLRDIAILIGKYQLLAMPSGNFQYLSIRICPDTVLCQAILFYRNKLAAVVKVVFCAT